MKHSLSQINYEYPKPFNFDANNKEFDIFKNVAIENCHEPKITFLKKVRIATNSVVFRYFKIFEESCISNINFEYYSKGYKFFLKFIFPKLNFSRKRFIMITDEWTSNYYHWHIFALTRLLVLKNENLIENSLFFLPKKYKKYKFVLPSLAKFGVKKEQIVFLARKSNIKVSEVALVKAAQNHPVAFNEIRNILLKDVIETNLDFGDKVYVSRAGQVLRFVENENEVVNLLEKYGFKKVIIDQFSYDEQIAICSKVKYLVSPHGAGLTNILFLPEKAFILEMASKPYEFRLITDYYKLASMLNVNYLYQECEMGQNSPVKDFHQGSLVVDLEKLEKNLQLMLNHG